jgi:hypothetical protein
VSFPHTYRVTFVGPTGYSECVEIEAHTIDDAEYRAERIRSAQCWVHAQIDSIDGVEVIRDGE